MKTSQLLLIQASLKAPKNQKNAFGGYNYRSCEDILEAVKPLLYETNTTLTISDNMVEVGGRVYVEATATLRDAETGEVIEQNVAYAREEEIKKWMDAAQITWAASSYARKYALNWLFCIDDVKDADATNTHWKEKKKAEAEPEQITALEPKVENPNGWFKKAIESKKFMESCLDEDDFINKIKSKYEVGEIEERQLREAYKNHMWIDDGPVDLPFN